MNKLTPALLTVCVCTALLSGCPNSGDNAQAPSPASTTPTPPPATAPQSTYVPPTAEQLRQLVAPIAIFPDKLVAQVLAGATYPDQISAAYDWQSQNPGLKGSALQNAVDPQPWDPSVKSLTTFPEVLHQMAGNLPWTTALGDAYVNDPTDVMNAIQALREQAAAAGHLKSNAYLNVVSMPSHADNAAPEPVVTDDPPVYAGPAVVPAPSRVIEIVPSNPDVVYVPTYDPAVIYGEPIALYPGYAYAWPRPIYYGPYYGGLGFGLGIAIGFSFGHPWGWGAWGIHWGPRFHGWGYRGWGDRGWGYRGPAVVYNNQTYISHSTTVINHFGSGNHFGNTVQRMPPGVGGGAAFAHTPHTPFAPGASMTSSAFHPATAAAHMPTPMAQHMATRPNFNTMSMPSFSHAMTAPGFRQRAMTANLHAPAVNTANAASPPASLHNAASLGQMHPASPAHTTAGATRFNPQSFAAQQHASVNHPLAAAPGSAVHAPVSAPTQSFNQSARAPSYRPAENNRPYQAPHAYMPPRPNYANVNHASAPAYRPMASAAHSSSPHNRPSGGGGHTAPPRATNNHHAR
ncbi:DUF3300 domain-containing protein [Dyella tabacisoli]|nr:DUF3300 domain-containing protein [Dyella tabacisoli]